MKSHPSHHRNRGFTLLELVLAMALMVILVGMIFGTAHTSLSLGNTIVKTQNEEMLHQAFFELLNRRFTSLPGNTRFDLKVSDSGTPYISDITLQNVPLSFTWGGQASTAQAVQLSTVKKRSGFLDIVLRYYEEEILENSASPVKKSAIPKKPIAEIILLTDVAYFEWRVLDGRSMNWQYEWDQVGRLPLQLELIMSIGARGEEIRQVFWVVPKLNPQNRIAQNQAESDPNNSVVPNTPLEIISPTDP
jgi:prepilin-type N-terminal cleavage/methylation domain-containing protein